MRTIKFRGKHESGVWVYGYYWTNEVGNHFIRVTKDERDFYVIQDYEVIPETVGQFTGLTDKNGKEIYEGDVVQWCDYKMLIVWGEIIGYGFGFKWSPINHERRESITGFIDEYKVIGNIHDNPELLGGNK